jgi:hypothetical protein
LAASRPEQAAADHDRVPARARRRQHGVDVVQVAKADHAGQLMPGTGTMKGFEPVAISRRS